MIRRMLSKLIGEKLSTAASLSSPPTLTLPLNFRSKRSFVATPGRQSQSLGAIDAPELQSCNLGKWEAVISLFVFTSGWRNTSAAEITGTFQSRLRAVTNGSSLAPLIQILPLKIQTIKAQ